MSPFRAQLEERAVSQEWWQLQQSQYRNGVWDRPKIVYPYICSESRFTLDREGIHANMNAFIIPCDDLFLLGVLSSSVVWEYLKRVCAVLGAADDGGRLLLKMEFMKDVPIPPSTENDRKAIAKIVSRCLSNPDTWVDEAAPGNLLWDDDIFRQLTDFQQDAVRQATAMIRKNRGAFIADVVGLGKSFIVGHSNPDY